VLAAVENRLAGPGGLENPERLIEHPCATPVVELLAGDRVLAGEVVAAEPDSQRQPATAEQIEGRRLARDLAGRRRASGVTIGPNRIRSVAAAIVASVIWVSPIAFAGSRQWI
jgi:hypothetical protein